MIKIVDGSLLGATENILCHQVNCQGIMGAGAAKVLIDKYPKLKPLYQEYCKRTRIHNNTSSLLGNVYLFDGEDGHIVANLFGQDSYGGAKGILYTDYTALEIAFVRVRDYALLREFSIAMPYRIGCGLANGDWNNKVYPMIERVFHNIDVTLYKI